MNSTVVVKTRQGQLRGKKVTTANGFAYYSFQGIPYAKPPIGALRFKVSSILNELRLKLQLFCRKRNSMYFDKCKVHRRVQKTPHLISLTRFNVNYNLKPYFSKIFQQSPSIKVQVFHMFFPLGFSTKIAYLSSLF